jgi:beta-glucosidase
MAMDRKIKSAAVQELLAEMTLEEKASLCSGRDFWHLKGNDRLGIPAVLVADGRMGYVNRPVPATHFDLSECVPATCFPTASALAATWNRGLMYRIGEALAEECRVEKVAVIWG